MDERKNQDGNTPCTCLRMRRASQAITRVYDTFLEPCGLKISQFSLIRFIGRLGPVNVSDLSTAMKLDRTTLVRGLKPFEEKGLIADIAEKGSRNRQLILTEDGRNALTEAEILWRKAQGFVEQRIGRQDLAVLFGLLAKIEEMGG